MHCPRCRSELDIQDIFTGGLHATIAVCRACGGQWMRDTDLERLSEVTEPVVIEWREFSPGAQEETLRCPQCESAPVMRKLRSSRDAHVLLDTCDACGGVWLDGGELRAIQQESLAAMALSFFRQSRS